MAHQRFRQWQKAGHDQIKGSPGVDKTAQYGQSPLIAPKSPQFVDHCFVSIGGFPTASLGIAVILVWQQILGLFWRYLARKCGHEEMWMLSADADSDAVGHKLLLTLMSSPAVACDATAKVTAKQRKHFLEIVFLETWEVAIGATPG